MNYPFLQGGGEMGEQIRNFDWSQTSLGDPGRWSQALQISLSNILNSGFPMFLFWGDELTCFYNDAFRPSLGVEGKHPAIGKKGREVWNEIWDFIGPLINSVLSTGKPVWFKDQLVPFYRNGQLENIYWTFSYSLLLNDDGKPGGVLVTCMETTEAVMANQRIEKSQQELLQLFNESPVAIAKISNDLVFQYANSFYGSLVGRKPEEIVGKPLLQALPEINGQGFDHLLSNVIKSGKPYIENEVPVDIIRSGKMETIYVDLTYQPRIERDGSINGVLVVALDVTQQVRARKKIEESEAKYRMLFESMDQAYCTLEVIFEGDRCVDFRYLETNPTFERHLGISNALGKTIRDIAPDIEQKWFDFYGGVALTGNPIRIEEESKAFNKWFEVYAVRVGRAEKRKVGVFFTDVTKRKASELLLKDNEALLRTVFDTSPNSLTVYEEVYNEEGQIEDFRFVIVNEFTIRTTGRTDLVGKCYSEEFPHTKETGVMESFKNVAITGIPADFEKWYEGEGMRHWFRFIVNKVGKLLVVTTEDITKRKETERKTEESEAKLRSILNSAPTAMGVFVGYDMIVENPNQLLIDVMAAGPDIEGKSFRKLLDGLVEEEQKFIQLIDTVRTTGEPFEAQEVEVYFKAEKKTRYFNINFIPLRDEKGDIYAVLDVSVDVTEQVQARRKTEESEGRFRLLADASPILIWMLKPDGAYAYVNKTTLAFLGITQEEIAENGWEPYQHPDDLAPASETINKAIKFRQPFELVHRLRQKDGQYRWVLSQANPAYDADGHVFAFVGSSIDIHEAKKSREELQTALEQVRLSKEAAELGTFDMDLAAGTLHWDDRCRTLFGISHHDPVSFEEDFLKRLHPGDQARVEEVIRHSFDKALSNGDYDVEYRTIGAEDGVLRWVRAKGKVYFNSNDVPVRFIGSVLDISENVMAIQKIEKTVEERTKELAQANEALQQINKELQRSNQNLEEFAHAASHDLKEPIRKIHFFTHQLRDQLNDSLKEAEVRSFVRIENATLRMGNLIDDLLLYSHVSQRPHETEPVDLNEKVKRVLEDLDLDIEEKKATINVGKLPVVQGYRRQLQQLFQNLLSNSLKYSKAWIQPEIAVTAEEVNRYGKSYHLIRVVDNGIGFANEYKDKIFQMFARLHGKAEYSGTGVGLSIVKKVVENHNGFIEVDSEPGKGSTFCIYLPVNNA